jgi:hypothetical protein
MCAADDSAKLLARLIKADPTMLGYTDIGRAAFGSVYPSMVGSALISRAKSFALSSAAHL